MSKKIILTRLLIHKYVCLCAFAVWSPTDNQYIQSHPFLIWNCFLLTYIGQFYPIILGCFTYTKLTPDNDDMGVDSPTAGMVFTTTNCMGMALTCGIGIIAVAAYRNLAYYTQMTYLINQIYKLGDKLEELMSRKRAHFNAEQKRIVKACEYVLLLAAIFSTIIPLAYGLFFTSRQEPVHQLFQEWLEVEVKRNARSLPFVFLFMWAALAGAGAAFMMLYLAILYIFFTLVSISCLTPTNIYQPVRKAGSRIREYVIKTTSFGLLSEEEAILEYRTQQLLSRYMNEVVESVLISLHQFAFMVILVGASFMFIIISRDLDNAEVSVVAFVSSVIFCVVLMVSGECVLIGKTTDWSKQYLVTSKNMTYRRSMYKKFLQSCTKVSLNVAYPFFTIDKNTFVQFMCQYLDFLIQLLVGQ
ncbi:unnamed protein product [Orchesella dallaii]|uniref:Odorant receptor n=1 Tax=Orchesella dallaii TaxID=48710 RepID=A0ABP1R8F5_9HEXA